MPNLNPIVPKWALELVAKEKDDALELTPEQIEQAIIKAIDKCISATDEVGHDLHVYDEAFANIEMLFKNVQLTPKVIDYILDKEMWLGYLYTSQKLSPSQIDKGIDIGLALEGLISYQKVSKEQVNKIVEAVIEQLLNGEDTLGDVDEVIGDLINSRKVTQEQKERLEKALNYGAAEGKEEL